MRNIIESYAAKAFRSLFGLYSAALRPSLPLNVLKKDILFLIPPNGHFLKAGKYLFFPQIDHLVIRLSEKYSISVIGCLPVNILDGELYVPVSTCGGLIYALLPRLAYWLLALSISRPRLIAGIGLDIQLLRAAKILSIPIVEIYHSYCYQPEFFARYAFDRKPKNLFHVVYDDRTLLSLSCHSVSNVHRAKLPYLERKKYLSSLGLSPFKDLSDYLRTHPLISDSSILVTLQPSLHRYSKWAESDFICGVLHRELARYIKSRPDFNWIFKWHPSTIFSNKWTNAKAEMEEYFCDCPHAYIDGFDFFEVVDLFGVVSLHITMSSASVYEASLMGVKTLLFDDWLITPNTHLFGCFEDQIRAGMAEVVAIDSSSIDYAISNSLSSSHRAKSDLIRHEDKFATTADILTSIIES